MPAQNQTQALEEPPVTAAHFDDIRPYNDDEFPAIFSRLLREREFVDTLASMKFPRLFHWVPWLLRPFILHSMKRSFTNVNNLAAFQTIIGDQLQKLLDKDGSQLTVAGLGIDSLIEPKTTAVQIGLSTIAKTLLLNTR